MASRQRCWGLERLHLLCKVDNCCKVSTRCAGAAMSTAQDMHAWYRALFEEPERLGLTPGGPMTSRRGAAAGLASGCYGPHDSTAEEPSLPGYVVQRMSKISLHPTRSSRKQETSLRRTGESCKALLLRGCATCNQECCALCLLESIDTCFVRALPVRRHAARGNGGAPYPVLFSLPANMHFAGMESLWLSLCRTTPPFWRTRAACSTSAAA